MTDREVWIVVRRALLNIISVFDKKYGLETKVANH